jgi:hypothetical protein
MANDVLFDAGEQSHMSIGHPGASEAIAAQHLSR